MQVIQKLKVKRSEETLENHKLAEGARNALRIDQARQQKKIILEKSREMQLHKNESQEEIVRLPQLKGPLTPKTPIGSPKATILKAQSNKVLVRNALNHVCLAGTVNLAVKTQVIKVRHCYKGSRRISCWSFHYSFAGEQQFFVQRAVLLGPKS